MEMYSQNSRKTGTDSLKNPKENVWDHTVHTQSNGDMQSNGGISGTECLLSSKQCHKLNCTYTVKCRYIHCQMDINSQNDGKTGTDSLDKPKASVWHQTVHTQSNADIYAVEWRYAIKQQNKCHWLSRETKKMSITSSWNSESHVELHYDSHLYQW